MPVYSLSTSSRGNTTTTLPQEITITVEGNSIHLVDTPGLTFFDNERDLRARDILLYSKGRIDRLKDPSSAGKFDVKIMSNHAHLCVVVAHIVEHASAEDLMLMYNLPAFPSGDVAAFLSGVARSNHLVKKVNFHFCFVLPCSDVRQSTQRGEPDLAGASRIVLRDWNTGKFARYTCPPNDGGKNLTLITEIDKRTLNQSKTRKELRKNGGLVRLRASEEERRVVQMESPWENEKSSNENDVDSDQNIEEGEEGEEDEMEGSGSDEGKNGDTDEQEEKSEKELSTYNQKRKRTVSFGAARLAKKAAFAVQEHRKQDKLVPATDRKGQEDRHTKTILKKNTTTKKSQSLEISSSKSAKKTPAKVANVSSSYKSKTSNDSDPNAYDFSKFF